jgi:cytochrome c oxidase subunit 3
LDNAIATTQHAAQVQELEAEHEHVFVPQHRHHFETEEQQREAGSFGMWLFLLTEIMFFGGMFCCIATGTTMRSFRRRTR